jgi:hypothetical protein
MIREISNHDEDEGNMLSSGVPTPLDSFADRKISFAALIRFLCPCHLPAYVEYKKVDTQYGTYGHFRMLTGSLPGHAVLPQGRTPVL